MSSRRCSCCVDMGVSENSVPLNPMVLLIIIPMKNGYFIGNIPNIFRQTHIFGTFGAHVSRSTRYSVLQRLPSAARDCCRHVQYGGTCFFSKKSGYILGPKPWETSKFDGLSSLPLLNWPFWGMIHGRSQSMLTRRETLKGADSMGFQDF